MASAPAPKQTQPKQTGAIDPLRYVVKVNLVAAVTGLLFFTLAVTFCWWMFRAHVPTPIMLPWLAFSIVFLLLWLIAAILLFLRHPGDAEMVRIFAPIGTFVRTVSNLIVLATIWLFLPFAPRDLQLVMTVFYVAHVATQILSLPARPMMNAAGTLIIMGSVAAVHLWLGGDHARVVAAFSAAYALVMVLLGFVVARLIGDVMAQRRQSDETALALEAALADVAEERDAKTRFIAAASHDLGQPLQAANLFFSQHVRARDADQRSVAADGVRRAFAAAEQLLSHMLNHLRLEADAVDPQMASVTVDDSIRRLTQQHGPAAKLAGVTITAMPTRLTITADRVLLDRALGNLIDNAVAHSGASRLLVGARAHAADRVRIWVIDNGVGIGSSDARHIFDDYFRGSDSRARTRSGFGLGLASVRRIAQLMDGTAALDNRWIKGAAFYLDFPRGKAQNRDRP